MSRIPRLTSEQRADLVAYLDGELDEDDAREIEQVLAASEVARHEVEMLGRTWDLLETLPRGYASAEFAAKTLATVQVATAKPPQQWQPHARRGLIALAWATALAAAALVGFAIGHRWLPRQDEPFVDEFPLIQNLDAYQDAGSVEFIERLDRRRLTLREEDAP
ncbi:MAG: hypothetical protein WBC44_17720 [Planctomycetaceae bacterium]